MVGIYKITNPKGRVYVGQSKDIEVRWKTYKNLRCKKQRRLYYSLIKYGVNMHIFEVLEECTVESLNEREKYWQEYYNVVEEGLNLEINKSTEPTRILSEETRQKMSKAQKGKTLSNITKEKIRRTRIERGVNIHTEETKKKISETLRQRVRTQETFEKIAAKNRGKKRTDEMRQKMSRAKIGRRDNEQTRVKKSQAAKMKKNAGNPHSCKKVGQYTEDGTLLKVWKSMTEAAKELSTTVSNISTAIKTNKLRVGYFWKILTK